MGELPPNLRCYECERTLLAAFPSYLAESQPTRALNRVEKAALGCGSRCQSSVSLCENLEASIGNPLCELGRWDIFSQNERSVPWEPYRPSVRTSQYLQICETREPQELKFTATNNAPRVYSSNLSRCLVSPSMLTLLVRPGQDFKQFLTDGNWLAFVANHFFWLAEVSRVSRENGKFLGE